MVVPIHTLYSGYLLGPNPRLKGSNWGVKQLGHIPYETTFFNFDPLILWLKVKDMPMRLGHESA